MYSIFFCITKLDSGHTSKQKYLKHTDQKENLRSIASKFYEASASILQLNDQDLTTKLADISLYVNEELLDKYLKGSSYLNPILDVSYAVDLYTRALMSVTGLHMEHVAKGQ
ncbi:unnamed protein product [Cunninghamella blakesleeana]